LQEYLVSPAIEMQPLFCLPADLRAGGVWEPQVKELGSEYVSRMNRTVSSSAARNGSWPNGMNNPMPFSARLSSGSEKSRWPANGRAEFTAMNRKEMKSRRVGLPAQ
jgi:hypothetical protein